MTLGDDGMKVIAKSYNASSVMIAGVYWINPTTGNAPKNCLQPQELSMLLQHFLLFDETTI